MHYLTKAGVCEELQGRKQMSEIFFKSLKLQTLLFPFPFKWCHWSNKNRFTSVFLHMLNSGSSAETYCPCVQYRHSSTHPCSDWWSPDKGLSSEYKLPEMFSHWLFSKPLSTREKWFALCHCKPSTWCLRHGNINSSQILCPTTHCKRETAIASIHSFFYVTGELLGVQTDKMAAANISRLALFWQHWLDLNFTQA